jgi:hypothetical protein
VSANRRVIPLPPRKPAGFYGSIDDSLFRSIEDLRDVCLDGAECLYDPELHDGPADLVETFDQEAARVEVAKQVCATCPVLDACLAYALRVRPAFGVWAGRTTAELADLYDASGAAPVLGEIA